MSTRRDFLGGAALLGLGHLPLLKALPPLSADEVRLDPRSVRLDEGIAPLVRLIEETPREKLLEDIGARIRRGLPYRELVAALLLAGVRNVRPRPSVGHKFHAVLVVNSAHQASLSSPDPDRWLPIFWSLDYFKSSQAEEKRSSGWSQGAVKEASVPPAHKARQAFIDAMEAWDEEAADGAAAALARASGSHEAFELFSRFAGRDWRSIGHKPIFVAGGFRLLEAVGWRHAEPVLRSLASALLMHEGDCPAKRDDPADRPGRRNLELCGKIRAEWRDGKPDDGATRDLLAALRQGSEEDLPKKAVELLNGGVSPRSLWDAYLAGAGELVMRRPDIRSLHAATTMNALLHCWQSAGSDGTRRLLLLQAASFVTLFRGEPAGPKECRIDELEAAATGAEPVKEIFAEVSRDKAAAARKVLGFLKAGGPAAELMDAARVLVFLKGSNAHDYKFSGAALEDCGRLSPGWRERYLASSVFLLRGSEGPDNALVGRTRAALKA